MSLSIIGIHLDLKYLMPHKEFLLRWVADLPAMGINTLLLEYEDKFPFETYPFIRARNAFTPEELRTFLSIARVAGLRIVPLVQALSHLEFALSHRELAHLREAPHIPTQIDTSNPDASRFVEGLIDEVLVYHQEDEFFHLGGDEAWHLGCNERSKLQVERLGETGLWASHMLPLSRKIVDAGKRPMFWGDVVAATPSILTESNFPRESVFLAWHYSATSPELANKHCAREKVIHDLGYEVIASPCLNWGVLTPQHQHCLRNTAELTRYATNHGFMGVINTAWACFHVLPHAQSLYIACTGSAARSPDAILDPQWRSTWLAEHFGVSSLDLDDGLEVFGQLTEFNVEGLMRPLTLVVYGYMDYLLELGTQERRRAEGGYPSDISRIDFSSLFDKKLERLKVSSQACDAAVASLNSLIVAYDRHLLSFDRLAQEATRHTAEAKYMGVAARLKITHAKLVRSILTDQVIDTDLDAQWTELGKQLQTAIAPFIDPSDVQVAMQVWWGHTRQTLANHQAKLHGQSSLRRSKMHI